MATTSHIDPCRIGLAGCRGVFVGGMSKLLKSGWVAPVASGRLRPELYLRPSGTIGHMVSPSWQGGLITRPCPSIFKRDHQC
jgi:hypothetical protein